MPKKKPAKITRPEDVPAPRLWMTYYTTTPGSPEFVKRTVEIDWFQSLAEGYEDVEGIGYKRAGELLAGQLEPSHHLRLSALISTAKPGKDPRGPKPGTKQARDKEIAQWCEIVHEILKTDISAASVARKIADARDEDRADTLRWVKLAGIHRMRAPLARTLAIAIEDDEHNRESDQPTDYRLLESHVRLTRCITCGPGWRGPGSD